MVEAALGACWARSSATTLNKQLTDTVKALWKLFLREVTQKHTSYYFHKKIISSTFAKVGFSCIFVAASFFFLLTLKVQYT